MVPLRVAHGCWLRKRNCVVVVIVGGCEDLWYGYWRKCVLVSNILWGVGSVWIVFFENIVIMFADFVVCRVIPATLGTFRWRVKMMNIKFHQKKHPLVVTTLQLNIRRNNSVSSHILQQFCRCNQNV